MQNNNLFQSASEMSYTNNAYTKAKFEFLLKSIKEHLKTVESNILSFFNPGETVYIPDLHGDFAHLIITLYRHSFLEKDLNLKKEFKYVFLGDFYDRSPDADTIDHWLNKQILNEIEIYRLIGNHEFAFFVRKENGHPIIFPSQDAIKDMSNNFQITENLLKNIAEGNLLAAYVDDCRCRDVVHNISTTTALYIHSYAITNDFIHLDLDINTDINIFAVKLNERLKTHAQIAYEKFLHYKKTKIYNWEEIIKPFLSDPLFNIYDKKTDINTSFLWRRTGLPILKTYPCEIESEIPDNLYQIVGHTPVFSFNLPHSQPVIEPFIITAKNGSKIQFSDVGIGYYYKGNSFERPEVLIKNLSLDFEKS